MAIALITGASSGMGREFARQLAASGEVDEFWFVARRRENMEARRDELGVKARIICADLTTGEGIQAVKDALAEHKPCVQYLINCAGFGNFGAFDELSEQEVSGMIDLNVKAYVGITYVSLPYLVEGAEVYQLDSLSSFQPVPYIGVYGATKAFVLSFSRALNVELKHRHIHVMAVCPGWVKTEFFDHAVTDDTIKYYNRFFTAEQVITRALHDMKRRRDVSICGFSIRSQVFFTKLLPHKLVMKIWCKQQKK